MRFKDRSRKLIEIIIAKYIIILFFSGIICFIVVFLGNWEGYEIWQTILREFGGLLIVSTIISLIIDHRSKKIIIDDVLEKIDLKKEIVKSGIYEIYDSFQDILKAKWEKYFASAHNIDIFICYGRTWRHKLSKEFIKLQQRTNVSMRVILPDPNNNRVINELSKRFRYSTTQLIQYINEAIGFFKGLKNINIEIMKLPEPPLFSLYRFDDILIIAIFNHHNHNISVPTFICKEGGTLFDYFSREFEELVKSSEVL